MAPVYLTADAIAERTLMRLTNRLKAAANTYKGYQKEFHEKVNGYKKGDTIRIEKPIKFRSKDGAAIDKIEIQERSLDLKVETHKHIAYDFSEVDMTLDIDAFDRKYATAAGDTLANDVDSAVLGAYKGVYNQVGTPGVLPSTFDVLSLGALRLDQESALSQDRVSIISPDAYHGLSSGELKGIFNENMVKTFIREGFVGKYARADFLMDQNVQSHTVGNHRGDTITMNGSTSEGATVLNLAGFAGTTDVVLEGDILTVAAVYGVNNMSGDVWGNQTRHLRQFVATADATADGGGDAAVSVDPIIYSSSAGENFLPYQTVDVLPQPGAAVTISGDTDTVYKQNLMYRPDAIALTMVPFRRPVSAGKSIMWGQAKDDQLGLSITFSAGFDIDTYDETFRWDILFDARVIDAAQAVRITE